MNYNQSFEEFARGLSTFDIALYAGAGMILWVLFKDQLSPIQKMIGNLFNNIKANVPNVPQIQVPEIKIVPPTPAPVIEVPSNVNPKDKDLFFSLILAWKRTRDLAVESKCTKAVQAVDEMFPYLSPMVCNGENDER